MSNPPPTGPQPGSPDPNSRPRADKPRSPAAASSGAPKPGSHSRPHSGPRPAGPAAGSEGASSTALSPARRLALEAELASDRGEGFAADVLDANAAKRRVSREDLGLAREITAGSLRCRRALDALIDQFLKTKPADLHPTIRTILRQGACQLATLTRIPPHAAVDQAVEQSRGVKSGAFKGLVNAIMRRVSEAIVKRELPDDGGHSQCRFLARVQRTPTGELIQHWTELSLRIAPFFDVNPIEHLARVYNLPVDVVTEWRAAFGPERTIQLLVAANTLPALTVRLNPAALVGVNSRPLAEEQIFAGVPAATAPATPGPSVKAGIRRFSALHGITNEWNAPVIANPVSTPSPAPRSSAEATASAADAPAAPVRFWNSFPIPPEVLSGEWRLPAFLDDFYLCPPGTHPADLPGLEAGLFVVQDRAAGEAARVLDPQPGERILDLCAAPGGKTAQIAGVLIGRVAAAMSKPGAVKSRPAVLIACDAEPNRLGSILDTAERCKLPARIIADAAHVLHGGAAAPSSGSGSNAAVDLRVAAADGRQIPSSWHAQFDAVLVDAPCSNLGVLHRRWEARWRHEQLGIDRLLQLQKELLVNAAKALKPGGRLVYTTCTLSRAENENQLQQFLAAHPKFSLVKQHNILPTASLHDGAFYALLRHQPATA